MPLRSAPSLQAKILLVDGNSAGLAARRTVLEEQGHKVWVAANSADAFDQFGTQTFDIVVTDHKMPRMDGLGLIKKIHGVAPATPIVLLSGFVDALGLNEHTTGASAVIQKSAHEVTHLVRAVARLLKRKAPKKGSASEGRVARLKRAGA
ncbi:MAG: response regulator [Acidobacteriota bacterium]